MTLTFQSQIQHSDPKVHLITTHQSQLVARVTNPRPGFEIKLLNPCMDILFRSIVTDSLSDSVHQQDVENRRSKAANR